jgi:ABC-type Fe3+/spermidine/putrescine transport system ATPase subunit
LARAVVVKPKILLLDEPLSALDAQLREEMQRELRALQRNLGITAISVTHDQNEALGMSDRVAVMRNGMIEQVGTPETLYTEPVSDYIATFIGKAALISVVKIDASGIFIRGLDRPLNPARVKVVDRAGESAAVLRPEMLRVVNAPQQGSGGQTMLHGHVIATRFIGSSFLHEVALDDGVVATVDVASTFERIAVNVPVGLEVKDEYLANERG